MVFMESHHDGLQERGLAMTDVWGGLKNQKNLILTNLGGAIFRL